MSAGRFLFDRFNYSATFSRKLRRKLARKSLNVNGHFHPINITLNLNEIAHNSKPLNLLFSCWLLAFFGAIETKATSNMKN
jgi:hypothetical protein